VLERAAVQTVPELRRSLLRAAVRVDAESAERRRRRAVGERRVEKRPGLDGMGELRAILPAAELEAVWARIDGAAALLPADDERCLDAQRADVFVDAVLAGIPADEIPLRQGRRPGVNVVIDLATLFGLRDNPADLAGYGAITPELGRILAADPTATWRRTITDPLTGALLDYGTEVYEPPQALRDFILAKAGICVMPGCNQPAYRCDLDHRRPFSSGGQTNPENLSPLCRRHHRLKTHGGWRYEYDECGTARWTTSTGHQYTGYAPQRWSVDTLDSASQGDRNAQRNREQRAGEPVEQPPEDDAGVHRNQVEESRSQARDRLLAAIEQALSIGDTAYAAERRQRLADADERWNYLDSLSPDQPPF
jgi:Domain of unknown function (DUF222)/HNH endonuclease